MGYTIDYEGELAFTNCPTIEQALFVECKLAEKDVVDVPYFQEMLDVGKVKFPAIDFMLTGDGYAITHTGIEKSHDADHQINLLMRVLNWYTFQELKQDHPLGLTGEIIFSGEDVDDAGKIVGNMNRPLMFNDMETVSTWNFVDVVKAFPPRSF